MRFISPYSNYRIVIKHQDIEILASGLPRILKDGFTAEFTNTDVTDWEREEARRKFAFRGTVTDEAGRDIDPVKTRVATFDTSKIPDKSLREEVEKRLLDNPALGHDFILVEKPKIPAPWPSYDNEKVGAIAGKVKELGFNVDTVLAYERENKNRASVIDALEALVVETPEEELVTA